MSFIDTGYVYAPYVSLLTPSMSIGVPGLPGLIGPAGSPGAVGLQGAQGVAGIATTIDLAETRRKIRELMRLPAKIIRTAMQQAGYRLNKDFKISISEHSATIHVYSIAGRRFEYSGACQIHHNKGKINIFWTYELTPGGKAHDEVDIVLANPNSFKQISDTIVKAVKACRTFYNGKVTI